MGLVQKKFTVSEGDHGNYISGAYPKLQFQFHSYHTTSKFGWNKWWPEFTTNSNKLHIHQSGKKDGTKESHCLIKIVLSMKCPNERPSNVFLMFVFFSLLICMIKYSWRLSAQPTRLASCILFRFQPPCFAGTPPSAGVCIIIHTRASPLPSARPTLNFFIKRNENEKLHDIHSILDKEQRGEQSSSSSSVIVKGKRDSKIIHSPVVYSSSSSDRKRERERLIERERGI